VAIVYFDASALVKLVIEEEGSELAAALWDGCDVALASRLAYPEVRAALSAARRNRDLTQAAIEVARRTFETFWASIRAVELTEHVAGMSGDLAEQLGLRGADAVHLASALVVHDDDLVFAAWDRRLHAGAQAAGLRLAPRTL
jgi:predicted nucleic acid-binding protein